METIHKIKCIGGFRDGNVYPEFIPNGKILEVDDRLLRRLLQSDPGGFEILESNRKVPPPSKSKPKPQKDADAKKAKSNGNEG